MLASSTDDCGGQSLIRTHQPDDCGGQSLIRTNQPDDCGGQSPGQTKHYTFGIGCFFAKHAV